MRISAGQQIEGVTTRQHSEIRSTPELHRSLSAFGDSEDEYSLYPTPSDTTDVGAKVLSGSHADTSSLDCEEDDAQQIHQIDMLFEDSATHKSHANSSVEIFHSLCAGASCDSTVQPAVSRGGVDARHLQGKRSRNAYAVTTDLPQVSTTVERCLNQHAPQNTDTAAPFTNVHNNPETISQRFSYRRRSATGTESRPIRVGEDKASSSAAPENDLRAEVKKRMAEVAIAHDGLREELVKMNVDMTFYENAHRTIDERIGVLRARIAKRSASLQEQDRDVQDRVRKSRKKGKTPSQKAADVDEACPADRDQMGSSNHRDRSAENISSAPSESRISASARQETHAAIHSASNLDIGMSDEELARVLGISAHDLSGFSSSLELNSGPNAHQDESTTAPAGLPDSCLPATDKRQSNDTDAVLDDFDVAAFLEMASSTLASNSVDASL